MAEQQALDCDSAEAEEHLTRHGMLPNHLFEEEALKTPTKEATVEVFGPIGEFPQKKKTKNAAGALRTSNRYTTKGFAIPPTAHVHAHSLAFLEAAIGLTSEDKPKEFIMAIKLLLKNAKYLDPHFGLAPLKTIPRKQSKIIFSEDDIPSNFTHLGQYAFTSGNRIFEKKKNWNDNKGKQPHQDSGPKELKDPIVYFTIAIATVVFPCTLIDGIWTEWETHGGGKLQVKDLQSHKSKVMFVLYFVFRNMPFHIITKTLDDILHEAAEMLFLQRMLPDSKSVLPASPEISICAQVLCLKGVDTSKFDKLPYHVRENQKAIHIEAKPEDEKELKDLFQFAKEQNIVSLCLGKRAHISKVMDAESIPGEIKRMVKYAMGHANYQGLMTGETIVGIALLDGGVSPTANGGTVSLRMAFLIILRWRIDSLFLLNYIKPKNSDLSLLSSQHAKKRSALSI